MRKKPVSLKIGLLGLTVLLFGIHFASAETISTETVKKPWTYAVTPYFWFADIGATLEHGSMGGAKETDVEIGADDYLSHLKMAVPLALEARFGRWSILSDFLYMKLNDQQSQVKSAEFNSGNRIPINATANAGTNTTLELAGWTLLSGYECYKSKKGSFETTFGLRYFGTKASTDWNLTADVAGPGPGETFQKSGSVTEKGELWDMLLGFRGQVQLGESKLAVPYYMDFGSGESNFTWQWSTGLSYALSWGQISAVYRYLEYQTSGSNLLQDFTFSGPCVGVSFQF